MARRPAPVEKKSASASAKTAQSGGKPARKKSAGKGSTKKGSAKKSSTKKASTKKSSTKKSSRKKASVKAGAGTGSRRRSQTAAELEARAVTDARTVDRIETLGSSVVKQSLKLADPFVDVPTRSISNVRFNKSKRVLEMGEAKQRRTLFNLGQAKKFMQTLLVADGCRDLVQAGKTLSLRGMYYKSLHTIAGTKEKTFDGQEESDVVLEDLEVAIDSLRENLHVFAKKRGTMVGNITVFDNGDEIDCRRMGTGGYAIPSICEPSVIQFGKCEADFVLHVEKDTVWSRFNEDRFWEQHNCILTEGSGQPPRGVRRLLHRLNTELGLPIYCLLDCDPWGHYIYSVIKQGSINLAYESGRMAVPEAKFLGIRSDDYSRCGLTDDVKIELNDRDRERAKQIAAYPWFSDRRIWQKEIKRMISNGSCTTNCLAPLAKVLNDGIGIESGIMTTIHAYTGDQPTLDRNHKDLHRARAAALSMIPTSTGAAKAVGLVLPELAGKLDGSAVRVPTPNVSVIDLVFTPGKATSVEEIANAIKAAADGPLKGVLGYDTAPLVSIDYNHDSRSSVVALDKIAVIDERLVRVMTWYDNEWGFACRMLDTAKAMGRFL